MLNKKNTVLISGAVLFRKEKKTAKWFITKTSDDGGWELPKFPVRKGESSVRTSIRVMSEKGGMSVKVLEEAGRSGGATSVNGKVVPQRVIYYLMIERSGSKDMVGFGEHLWLPYGKAVRKLNSKRERAIFRQARKVYKDWKKKKKAQQSEKDS